VAIFGFGPLAGFLTLSFATIGFMSKLLAEDIEAMDKVQAEAIRASGASWMQLDQLRRAAAGHAPPDRPVDVSSRHQFPRKRDPRDLVGAGGIGATLNTAFRPLRIRHRGAILLIIIAIVMALEYLSGVIRARVQ
jgi:phosphonate transport system permease protein